MTLKLRFAFINDVITFTLNNNKRKMINNELFASFAENIAGNTYTHFTKKNPIILHLIHEVPFLHLLISKPTATLILIKQT